MSPTTRIKRFMHVVNIPSELRGTEGTDDDTLARMGRAIRRMKIPTKAILEEELSVIRDAKIPVLTVAGTWSSAFVAIVETVAEKVHGRTLSIPSPHHFPQMVSDEFNQALASFIDESTQRSLNNLAGETPWNPS